MTVEDAHTLEKAVGSPPWTTELLALGVIRLYRQHRKALEGWGDTLAERNQLRSELAAQRAATTRAKSRRPRLRELEKENERLRKLYEITLKRNEILSRNGRDAA